MKTSAKWLIGLGIAAVLIAACAKRPVLYPNYTFQEVGPEVAQADVDYCIAYAEEQDLGSNAGAEVAKKTATGAAVGGATGAVVGAITGGAGRGAAIGAAAGGVSNFMRGLFTAKDPDPVTKRFVERCLREAGYEPIGWK